MDVAIILTYRCNSKCSMCNIWKNPTLPKEEVSLETLAKIPKDIDYLNLTGGEPTLREDLLEIVNLLYPKAMTLEISSNGLYTNRLEPIIEKYPDVKIRLSLDGSELTNNKVRGEENGFRKKVDGLLRLKELGGCDLGFGMTIQDDNAAEAIDIFKLANDNGFELATNVLHNGFQFHKHDNTTYDRLQIAKHLEALIVGMLKTWSVKNWFRAYLSLGLIAKTLGHERLLRCTAGSSFAFIDPWSDVYACNVRPDLKMGNLHDQTWNEIMNGELAKEVRRKVYVCKQNCWMVGSAKTAMRHPRFAKIPKGGPMLWVIANKLRVMLNLAIPFDKYVDYSHIHQDENIIQRESYLGKTIKRKVQTKTDVHYLNIGEFYNK